MQIGWNTAVTGCELFSAKRLRKWGISREMVVGQNSREKKFGKIGADVGDKYTPQK